MADNGQFTADKQPKKRGRPRGSRNKLSLVIDKYRHTFVEMAFLNAMNPNHEQQLHWAGIVAKVMPTQRSTMPTYTITSSGDIKTDAQTITQAMNDGIISPDVAQAALAVCRDTCTIVELEDLERTIDKILLERKEQGLI
ncbi:hypothetical protein ACFSJY_04025 [Thalassotalea euphylliae]|uniref:hypothetical protein n=1 Tax=Thalassotalea euphylliae TaxID=1655234 RepID=UPI0036371E54